MWTALLVSTGMGGLWLLAKHWWGWLVYLLNEVLWFAYGLAIGAPPLAIMAVIWFLLGARNTVVAYRKAHT